MEARINSSTMLDYPSGQRDLPCKQAGKPFAGSNPVSSTNSKGSSDLLTMSGVGDFARSRTHHRGAFAVGLSVMLQGAVQLSTYMMTVTWMHLVLQVMVH